MDGVVVVNDIIYGTRRLKQDFLILKVDFEKLYDLVIWSLLDYVMRRVKFGDKWRS